jgi:hypothetical protein
MAEYIGSQGEYLHEYLLSTLGWSCLYAVLRLMWPQLDESSVAKRVSFVHAHVSLLLALWWVFFTSEKYSLGEPWAATFSSTVWALRICTVSGGYMLYDMHAALRFHQAFILHHIIAVAGFLLTHISGRFAGVCVHNILCTEVGGVFFHVNRLTPDASPLKSLTQALFLLFVGASRLLYFPFIAYNMAQAIHHGQFERIDLFAVLLLQLPLMAVNLNWFRTNVLRASSVPKRD